MPRKKKKKRKAQQNTIEVQFDYFLSDTTMLEGDGEFKHVNRIMADSFMKQSAIRIKNRDGRWVTLDRPADTDNAWCIKTSLTVYSPFGRGDFVLDCHHDRHIYIVDFMTSTPDKFQNPDIRFLTMWCQEKGWKIPQVTENVARENVSFWKHMWETLIIDCDHFDAIYGRRRGMGARSASDEPDEQDEEL